jgi:alpha-D-ribose 1-methylphosphonate 5-triphosphate synthase subunit PhnG
MHACMHAGKVCNKHAKGQADIGGVSSAAGACAQPEQRTASAWMPAALVSRPVKAILRQKTHGKQGGREPASGPPVAARVARATLSWCQQQQQRLRLCGCNEGVGLCVCCLHVDFHRRTGDSLAAPCQHVVGGRVCCPYRCVGCYQQSGLHHRSSETNVVHVVSRAACLLLPMCAGRAHVTRARVGVRNLTAAAGGVVATRHEPAPQCCVLEDQHRQQTNTAHTTRLLRPSTQRRADTHTMAKVRTQHSAAPAVGAPLTSTGPGGLPSSCGVQRSPASFHH